MSIKELFVKRVALLEKSRCIIGTQPNDRDFDTTGLLVFEEEGSALVMARQLVKINYSTVKN